MEKIENIIKQRGFTIQRELAIKEDSATLLVESREKGERVLRLYKQKKPIYAALVGHKCEALPEVFSYEEHEGWFWVEEAYIDGISIEEMLQGGTLFEPPRVCRIASAACRALAYIHGKGYIHRDIKPEHIILTESGQVFLVDLGVSMELSRQKVKDTQSLGTAGYAAPEQFGFSRSDIRTDIFAVGILINELLTGAHPSVRMYQKEPLKTIIKKCTSMNPDDRYQTAAELEKVLNNGGLPGILSGLSRILKGILNILK